MGRTRSRPNSSLRRQMQVSLGLGRTLLQVDLQVRCPCALYTPWTMRELDLQMILSLPKKEVVMANASSMGFWTFTKRLLLLMAWLVYTVALSFLAWVSLSTGDATS